MTANDYKNLAVARNIRLNNIREEQPVNFYDMGDSVDAQRDNNETDSEIMQLLRTYEKNIRVHR